MIRSTVRQATSIMISGLSDRAGSADGIVPPALAAAAMISGLSDRAGSASGIVPPALATAAMIRKLGNCSG